MAEVPDGQWSEHEIELETHPAHSPPAPQKPRRVVVLIGVGKLRYLTKFQISAPAEDVAAMERVLRRFAGVDEVIKLVDESATAEAIRDLFCRTLPAMTRPEDEVIIYFSGHGGRCADDNGDERDEYDEYLVPFDGRFVVSEVQNAGGSVRHNADRESMIIDDALARWIQELDNRRVVMIVDACYSGGLSVHSKSLVPLPDSDLGSGLFDDIEAEFRRIKDLGHEVVLFASSEADKPSLICRDRPISVMTRFLAECIESRPGPISLKMAADFVIVAVAQYAERHFANIPRQVPRLFGDEIAAQIVLKP